MYKAFSAVLLSTAILTGCAANGSITGSKETDGKIGGAVIGGLLGSQIGSGRGNTAAMIGGVLIGTHLGGSIGAQLDDRDRMLADKAAVQTLEYNEDGAGGSWSNPNTGHSGSTVPTKTYKQGKTWCRDYETTIVVDGKHESATGTACREGKDDWRI